MLKSRSIDKLLDFYSSFELRNVICIMHAQITDTILQDQLPTLPLISLNNQKIIEWLQLGNHQLDESHHFQEIVNSIYCGDATTIIQNLEYFVLKITNSLHESIKTSINNGVDCNVESRYNSKDSFIRNAEIIFVICAEYALKVRAFDTLLRLEFINKIWLSKFMPSSAFKRFIEILSNDDRTAFFQEILSNPLYNEQLALPEYRAPAFINYLQHRDLDRIDCKFIENYFFTYRELLTSNLLVAIANNVPHLRAVIIADECKKLNVENYLDIAKACKKHNAKDYCTAMAVAILLAWKTKQAPADIITLQLMLSHTSKEMQSSILQVVSEKYYNLEIDGEVKADYFVQICKSFDAEIFKKWLSYTDLQATREEESRPNLEVFNHQVVLGSINRYLHSPTFEITDFSRFLSDLTTLIDFDPSFNLDIYQKLLLRPELQSNYPSEMLNHNCDNIRFLIKRIADWQQIKINSNHALEQGKNYFPGLLFSGSIYALNRIRQHSNNPENDAPIATVALGIGAAGLALAGYFHLRNR